MLIDRQMQDAINEQIKEELGSAYIYLAAAAWFDANNWKGFSGWMKKQAEEEVSHAMKFYKYIYERGGEVELEALPKPKAAWANPLAVFETALEHERYITDRIHKLAVLAQKTKDPATESFLKWFVDEQVEEEDQALDTVNKLKLARDNISALMFLDARMGKRE